MRQEWLLASGNVIVRDKEMNHHITKRSDGKWHVKGEGNKRASVIFANHYLISHGGGVLVIPEKEVPEFKRLLVKYYEGEEYSIIATFLKERCWRTMQS